MGTMSSMKKLTPNNDEGKDKKLLRALRQGVSGAFEEIYQRALPGCVRYARANGGTVSEAKDVFEQSLSFLYENTRSEGFVLTTSLQFYLFAIFKRRWLMTKKTDLPKGLRKVELQDQDAASLREDTPPEGIYSDETKAQLQQALQKINEKCRNLLLDYYGTGIKLIDLAKDLDTTAGVLRVQKHRCLKKLKELMQKDNSHD